VCTAPAVHGKKKYLLRSRAAIALQSTLNARCLSQHLRFPDLARRRASASRYGDVRVLTSLLNNMGSLHRSTDQVRQPDGSMTARGVFCKVCSNRKSIQRQQRPIFCFTQTRMIKRLAFVTPDRLAVIRS
jgi:hypothetical protein